MKSFSTHTADKALTAGHHNCTTRRRTINIVICWSAVVILKRNPTVTHNGFEQSSGPWWMIVEPWSVQCWRENLNATFTLTAFVLPFRWVHKPGIDLCLSRILRLYPQCNDNGSEWLERCSIQIGHASIKICYSSNLITCRAFIDTFARKYALINTKNFRICIYIFIVKTSVCTVHCML